MDVLKRDPYTGGTSVSPALLVDNLCRLVIMFAKLDYAMQAANCNNGPCCTEIQKRRGRWPPSSHSLAIMCILQRADTIYVAVICAVVMLVKGRRNSYEACCKLLVQSSMFCGKPWLGPKPITVLRYL